MKNKKITGKLRPPRNPHNATLRSKKSVVFKDKREPRENTEEFCYGCGESIPDCVCETLVCGICEELFPNCTCEEE